MAGERQKQGMRDGIENVQTRLPPEYLKRQKIGVKVKGRQPVSRVLYLHLLRGEVIAIHLYKAVASLLEQPTRTSVMGSSLLNKQLCSYMVLLRMGFTLPALSPKLRCALTAPFHPYLIAIRRFVFCGTFPKVALAGRYPAS